MFVNALVVFQTGKLARQRGWDAAFVHCESLRLWVVLFGYDWVWLWQHKSVHRQLINNRIKTSP